MNNRIRRESQMVHLETKRNAAMQWWCAESSGTAVYSLGFFLRSQFGVFRVTIRFFSSKFPVFRVKIQLVSSKFGFFGSKFGF